MQGKRNGNDIFHVCLQVCILFWQNQKEITGGKCHEKSFCFYVSLKASMIEDYIREDINLPSFARVSPGAQAVQILLNYRILQAFLTPESNTILRVNRINS